MIEKMTDVEIRKRLEKEGVLIKKIREILDVVKNNEETSGPYLRPYAREYLQLRDEEIRKYEASEMLTIVYSVILMESLKKAFPDVKRFREILGIEEIVK